MQQIIFESVEALLERAALSELLGARVQSVKREMLNVSHLSGSELQEIRVEMDAGQTRLILKTFHPSRDWVMRLTHDTLTREAMLFAHGIYARMPQEIFIPVIAIARTSSPPPLLQGEGGKGAWATLMRDVSAELLPANQPLPQPHAQLLLEHLAALHAQFWNDAALQNPALGLSSLEDFLTILSPARVQAEIDAGRTNVVMEMAARGWKEFFARAPNDVQKIIRAVQENPATLMSELEAMPQTLVHGDFKLGHLGIGKVQGNKENEGTVVLDCQDATRGAGVLDLGYFLALNARWLPFSKEDAIRIYRNALNARGHLVSTREIEIGLFAGGALRLLWSLILNQQNELEWWYDLVRRTDNG